ncbi:MAG: hypothetical protein P0Y49_06880 [Candidatus Pedobacter colombiensis]|uniref:Uncharacterized protein n=1 Tax=Candidatus Pedobacter colombiensis TaxID=3121371 RepID=A0AAJ5WAD5_9SPHI|nr:hypothetical protein [Pedobacter sp.]WEK20859.1 MAG: hypothetical protein P0Y49_06880 [Pedobacter sp.]
MKQLKKLMRFCTLFLFMVLALVGIGITGVPPTLSRDRKLFADTESVVEITSDKTEKMQETPPEKK